MDGVIILGAGLSGLGCALSLPKARVFEASPHAGGHSFSHPDGGVHFDEGAHICHSKDQTFLRLLSETCPQIVKIPRSVVRNFSRGSWLTYPVQNHLNELPLEDRLHALADFVRARAEWSQRPVGDYLQWCESQYGTFLTERFYRQYTKKYWRVPMAELSTDWLGGRLLPAQIDTIVAGTLGSQPETQMTFAQFQYPARGGFFDFFESLYRQVHISFNARAVEIDPIRRKVVFETGREEHYTSLASSVPLPKLIEMIPSAPSHIRDCSRKLRHTQLLCVNLLVRRTNLTDNHWFYIYDESIEASRVSVPTNLSPDIKRSSPLTAIQAEVFRRHDEPIDVDGIVERTVRQMAELLKFSIPSELISARPVVVPYAYVIPDNQRAPAVATILAWLRERDIYPMGLYGKWKYLWSDQTFRDGEETANEIKKGSAWPSNRKSA